MSDTNKRYPDSTFSTEYPYNQATITRSGHEFHINDAPDNESLKISHTKGTFVEINKDGRWTQTVVEKVYNYFKDGYTETVDGHKDVKIGGNLNHNVDNSINDVVGGERTIATGDTLVITTGGARVDHTSDDKTETVDGDLTLAVTGDSLNSVVGDQVNQISGIKKDILSDWQLTADNIEMLNTEGTFRIKTGQFILEADSILIKTSSGATISLSNLLNILVDGTATISASQIHLNDI
jgi:hypothetical protein